MQGKIAPSMMCADPLNLDHILLQFQKNKIEYLHMDVMDGEFVQNISLGTDFIEKIRKASNIPLDIHLMINNPELKFDWFNLQPGEIVSIHYEATKHVQRALSCIRNKGAIPFIALNPGTPCEVIEELMDDIGGILVMSVNPGFAGQKMVPHCIKKIAKLKVMLQEAGREDALIEVDGNVSFENAIRMREAGADIFVAGTASIFDDSKTMDRNIDKMRSCIQ
ncbi:MAG: ribulose-phosphate 3-epimerase [Mobilitalea sp.]